MARVLRLHTGLVTIDGNCSCKSTGDLVMLLRTCQSPIYAILISCAVNTHLGMTTDLHNLRLMRCHYAIKSEEEIQISGLVPFDVRQSFVCTLSQEPH
jgi:hypothetical protein